MRRRVVVIDHHDSFTWNLVQYLDELGAECRVLQSDRTGPDEALAGSPRGVLLSPGPGSPDGCRTTEAILAMAARRVPLLGVCLGHQLIARHFGAAVGRAPEPCHGRAAPIHHDGTGLFAGLPSPFLAARYHSLAVDEETLPPELSVTARSTDRVIMGLRHRALPIEGVQFHPESILSEHGKALLDRWLRSL